MPRRTVDLEPYRQQIEAFISVDKKSYTKIAEELVEILGFKVHYKTIETQCHKWGITRRKSRTYQAEVIELINKHFHHSFMNDKQISEELQRNGHSVTMAHVASIRRTHGWKRRPRGGDDNKLKQQQVNEQVQSKLSEGTVRQYGIRLLHSALRVEGIYASRDQVGLALRSIDPDGVASRGQPKPKRPVGYYRTAGPNWLWAVDGHAKLARWDIEIYGCIDTYSRYIQWLYVGHSASTQVSVAKQFLTVVRQRSIFPKRIRADRGVETPMMADIQYNLYRNWLLQNSHCTASELDEFPLRDCFIFGPSTKNVKIESWWGQLQKSQLRPWVEYFRMLEQEGHWTGTIPDRVILLFFFMPLVRSECQRFVHYWNEHKIRSQTNRPNVVSGRPSNLYLNPAPGVPNYGRQPPNTTLTQLEQLTSSIDEHAYLPAESLAWCTSQLQSQGFSGIIKSQDFIRDHCFEVPWYFTAVLTAARHHYSTAPEGWSSLRLLDKPNAGYRYKPTAAAVRAWQCQDNMDVFIDQIENFMEDGQVH